MFHPAAALHKAMLLWLVRLTAKLPLLHSVCQTPVHSLPLALIGHRIAFMQPTTGWLSTPAAQVWTVVDLTDPGPTIASVQSLQGVQPEHQAVVLSAFLSPLFSSPLLPLPLSPLSLASLLSPALLFKLPFVGCAQVTSDGSSSRPHVSWSSSCSWTSTNQALAATALCTVGGYDSGAYVSASNDPCSSSFMSGSHYYFKLDSGLASGTIHGPSSPTAEAQITATCCSGTGNGAHLSANCAE